MVDFNRYHEQPISVSEETLRDFISQDETAARHALDIIVQKFHRLVFFTAMAVVRNQEASEDIAQQTFLKAWQRRQEFTQPNALGGWLRTIAQRTALDVVRANKVRAAESLDQLRIEHGFEPSDQSVNVMTDWLVSAHTADQLSQITAGITELAKTENAENIIMIELYRKGYNAKAMREYFLEQNPSIDIPTSTIAVRVHRTINRLRRTVEHLSKPADPEVVTKIIQPSPDSSDPRSKLIAAIAGLKDHTTSDILYSSLVKGERDEVIAERLGITRNAASLRISHGRKQLATILGGPVPELYSVTPRLDRLRHLAATSSDARGQLAKLVTAAGRASTVQLLTLYFIDGLSVRQIVDHEGLKENSVRQAVFRATQKFEEILATESTIQ